MTSPLAHDAEHAAAGHPGQKLGQEIVEPHPAWSSVTSTWRTSILRGLALLAAQTTSTSNVRYCFYNGLGAILPKLSQNQGQSQARGMAVRMLPASSGGVAHMYRKSCVSPFPRGWSLVGPRNRGHRVGPTRLLHPIEVSQTNDSGRAVGRATKGFRQPPFRGRVLMKSETRSPLSFYVMPHAVVRPPVVCLSAPHCWVKAEHEENASQRHSTGRAAGRSG